MISGYHIIRARVPFERREVWTDPKPVHAGLAYDTRDPYAVMFTLLDDPGDQCWLFSRELLSRGMVIDTGDGDVRVTPSPDRSAVIVELGSPQDAAMLQTTGTEINAFLNRTYQIVPAGEESRWIDFDYELAKLR